MQSTIWLALIMAAIAVVNAALMTWLWRFPMIPIQPGGLRRPGPRAPDPV